MVCPRKSWFYIECQDGKMSFHAKYFDHVSLSKLLLAFLHTYWLSVRYQHYYHFFVWRWRLSVVGTLGPVFVFWFMLGHRQRRFWAICCLTKGFFALIILYPRAGELMFGLLLNATRAPTGIISVGHVTLPHEAFFKWPRKTWFHKRQYIHPWKKDLEFSYKTELSYRYMIYNV